MKLNHLTPLLLAPVAVSLLQGCAHPTSASTFTPGQAQQVQTVTMGVVETVRPVTAESRMTRRAGVEIGVRLDSGQLISVTQDADQFFSPGDRVRVLSGGGATRVTR